MRLEVEGRPAADGVGERVVRSAVTGLRSYGPSSFASLTDETGNYLQVAGGGVTCMLERRDAITGRHFRAYHDEPSKVFADGTILAFGGGKIPLASDEWFTSNIVADAFCAFLRGDELPLSIKWRDMTESISGK